MNIKGLNDFFVPSVKNISPIDSEIKTLEDKKTALMQQLSMNEENNSLDIEKIKDINNQIQDIDKEIHKKQIEKLKESQKTDIEDMIPKEPLIVSGKNESRESIISNSLITANNMHKNASIMNSSKNSLRREINILKSGINSSEKKTKDLEDKDVNKMMKNENPQLHNREKVENLSKLENRLESINNKVIEKYEDINQHLKDAVEEANKKDITNDVDRNNRIEERKDRDIRKKKLKEAQIQHIKKLENIVEDYAEFKVNSLIK